MTVTATFTGTTARADHVHEFFPRMDMSPLANIVCEYLLEDSHHIPWISGSDRDGTQHNFCRRCGAEWKVHELPRNWIVAYQ